MVLHNRILANYLKETSEYSLRSNSEILLQPINNQNYKFKKSSIGIVLFQSVGECF